MFQALVLACLIFEPTKCWQLEDQRGPYKSYEQCKARAYEMSQAVHIHMRGYRPVSWKCQRLPEGKLST
jgi:hypothetical protein